MKRRENSCRFKLPLLLVLLALSSVCGQEQAKNESEVLVSAAASLQFVLPELAEEFEERTGRRVLLSFAASGAIASQIRSGAPIDLFLSADEHWVEVLQEEGHLLNESVACYALGILAVACPQGSTDCPRSWEELGKNTFARVGLSNPALSPYGLAAVEALKRRNLYDDLSGAMIFGQNVGQVLAFIVSGNVDFGFVPLPLAEARFLPNWKVPLDAYDPLRQVLALTKYCRNRGGAEEFAQFLLSERAQEFFGTHGFGLDQTGAVQDQ